MTKSGAKGASVIHPNDIALNVGAQLVLLTGPDSVRLNVFSPCEGFMQEALWSGTEHMWSSVPAAAFTSSAVCPHPQAAPPPSLSSTGRPVNLRRDTANHQDETT